jgi:hypothetical protein
MGVKVYDIYTGGTDWFLNNNVVKNVFSNPINTAIMIVMVMVLLVAFYYKDYDGDDRYGKLFRVGLYGGLFTIMAVFIHNTLLSKEYNKKDIKHDEQIIFGTNQLHPDEYSAIKPSKGRGEITLNDIPDVQTQSSDESSKSGDSDILGGKTALKIEDLV